MDAGSVWLNIWDFHRSIFHYECWRCVWSQVPDPYVSIARFTNCESLLFLVKSDSSSQGYDLWYTSNFSGERLKQCFKPLYFVAGVESQYRFDAVPLTSSRHFLTHDCVPKFCKMFWTVALRPAVRCSVITLKHVIFGNVTDCTSTLGKGIADITRFLLLMSLFVVRSIIVLLALLLLVSTSFSSSIFRLRRFSWFHI